MINIAEKTKNIGCYVTENEYQRIHQNARKYGYKNISDYIRSALEFFDARRYNASKNNEINIIQDCIDLLENHKKEISNKMILESLKNIDENLEEHTSSNSENLEEIVEKPSNNLEGFDDKTFKESDTNFEGSKTPEINKTIEPFENIIQTLIRITAVKGKPSDKDFEFQASRCGKRTSEVTHYYEDNYEFFVRESDKYH